MRITLHVWRQRNAADSGRMVQYQMDGVSEHMSFLEMLDVLNDQLVEKGEEPIAFDHDCREGICGSCGFMINGVAHGPLPGVTVCQLHMRSFKDGDELYLEPWRARAFPVVKDLAVDRSAFDRIIASGGFISVATGSAPDGNAIPIPKVNADRAMDAAACIGCGACVAACPECGSGLVYRSQDCASRLAPARPAGEEPQVCGHGRPDEFRALWELHEHRGMRSRMSEADPARSHRPDEPGLPQSGVQERLRLYSLS